MSVHSGRTRHSSRLIYPALIGLLIGLFLVGLELGRLAVASPRQADPVSGAEDKSSGGAIVNPPFQVHDFALTNQDGALMRLKDLRGQAVVLFFGYTYCTDVCPKTLADFTQVKTSLGSQAEQVSFVFVTVDGQRDTPAVLKDYLKQFDPGFIGLTGDETTLGSMAAAYGASFSLPADPHTGDDGKDHHEDGINSDNYFVQHTSPSYVIDPKGFLRLVYFYGTSPSVIAHGVQQILQGAG